MNAFAVHWDILKQDLRYTARTLSRARGFALTAIVIVALGVGANTAAFSVTDFVLFRPLPFKDADRLVTIWQRSPGYARMELAPANIWDWKRAATSFERRRDSQELLGEHDRRRRAGARRRRDDQRGSVSDPGRARGARTHLRRRRRQRSAPPKTVDPERRLVAGGVRRRPERPRPEDRPRRGAVLGDRRDAAGLQLSRAGVPRSGCRSCCHPTTTRIANNNEFYAVARLRPGATLDERTRRDGRARGAEPPAVSEGEREHRRRRCTTSASTSPRTRASRCWR